VYLLLQLNLDKTPVSRTDHADFLILYVLYAKPPTTDPLHSGLCSRILVVRDILTPQTSQWRDGPVRPGHLLYGPLARSGRRAAWPSRVASAAGRPRPRRWARPRHRTSVDGRAVAKKTRNTRLGRRWKLNGRGRRNLTVHLTTSAVITAVPGPLWVARSRLATPGGCVQTVRGYRSA
jgi:hypothetical protein